MVCRISLFYIESTLLTIRNLVPFVVTIVVALLFSTYMLLDPAKWLFDFMQLTTLSMDFRVYLLALACVGFGVSWMAEKNLLPRLAKLIGQANDRLRPRHKKNRKQYKTLLEELRLSYR
jgi:cation-transporting ATPase 13A2